VIPVASVQYLRLVASQWTAGGSDQGFGPALRELTWSTCSSLPCASSPDPSFAGFGVGRALDGDLGTYWQPTSGSSFGTSPLTFEVALAAPTSVSSVTAHWYSASFMFVDYVVQTSGDGVAWSTVATVTGNAQADRTDVIPVASVQYLRLVASQWTAGGSDQGFGPALREFSWST
jgi:F5/8 type C domain